MAQNLCIAALLHKMDVRNRSNAYRSSIGVIKNVPRLEPSSSHQNLHVPVLTAHAITFTTTTSIPMSLSTITTNSPPAVPPVVSSICSVPILLYHDPPVNGYIASLESDGSDLSTILQVASNYSCHWLYINDVSGSF